MRIKNKWFRSNSARGSKDIAGAVAVTAFRIAQNALKNMRTADFDIDPGPQYFTFLAEWLAFLVQVADRIAHERMEEEDRVEFTSTMARRIGELLEENWRDLLGEPSDASPGSSKAGFITLLNRRAGEYASHDYDEDEGPDYGFRRHLAYELVSILEEKDKTWVHDQVMEMEAPDAAVNIRKSFLGLMGEDTGAPRRGPGVAGD